MTCRVEVSAVGASGRAVALEAERLTAVLDRAFAPGEPARLVVGEGAAAVTVDGRALGSRRREDGAYDVGFRLVNLRREARAALAAALAPSPPS